MLFRRTSLFVFAAAFFTALPMLMAADNAAPATLPSPAVDEPTNRPILEELNQETMSLFREMGPTIVRVELPVPQLAMTGPNPMNRWISRLDPESLRVLQDIWSHAPQNSIVRIDIHPASSTQPQLAAAQNGGQADGQAGGQILLRIPAFTPNGIGFVLDADQHLVIPCFVDPAEFHGPIRVQMGDERMATATFVGSDEKTNLTVLKLRDVLGKPAKLNAAAPEPGTLLMVISLNPALNRLAVWPGWAPDFATIITDDGHVAGFTNGGRFFLAGDYQPVVHELITFGQVRRPVLGVVVEEVDDRDPQRADPALGNTPALRIIETLPGYPATLAGIKKGDLILGLGDQPAGDKFLFSAVLARQQGKTDITIFRDHAQMHFTLDLTPP